MDLFNKTVGNHTCPGGQKCKWCGNIDKKKNRRMARHAIKQQDKKDKSIHMQACLDTHHLGHNNALKGFQEVEVLRTPGGNYSMDKTFYSTFATVDEI